MPPSSGQVKRCIPNRGRRNDSLIGTSTVSAALVPSIASNPLTRNTRLPRTQHSGRLGDPAVGIAPDRGPVLTDRKVEARIGKGQVLGVPEMQGKPHPGLLLHPTRCLELPRGVVYAHRFGTAFRELGGQVGRPAAELDDVETVDRCGQHPDPRVGISSSPQVSSSADHARAAHSA